MKSKKKKKLFTSTHKKAQKKAQLWIGDIIISILIFLLLLTMFYVFYTNTINIDSNNLNELILNAKSISYSLMSQGYPENWKTSTVERIGLTDNNQKLNKSKWNEFFNISYDKTKNLLNTRFDYFVFFEDKNSNIRKINGVTGKGHPNVNITANKSVAYYYSQDQDQFMKDRLLNRFNADIYCDNKVNCDPNDLDAFLNNLSKYQLIFLEDPHLDNGGTMSDEEKKDKIEEYTLTGGIVFLSEHIKIDMLGVEFTGGGEEDGIVINTDPYLNFSLNDTIEIEQKASVSDENTTNFIVIAEFDEDKKPAIAKWRYGNGKIYYFSDFDTEYGNDTIQDEVEDAVNDFLDDIYGKVNLPKLKELVKIVRLIVVDNEIMRMVIYTWI